MRKKNRNDQTSSDHYEDIVRLEKLDAYEALIKYNLINKKTNLFNSINL